MWQVTKQRTCLLHQPAAAPLACLRQRLSAFDFAISALVYDLLFNRRRFLQFRMLAQPWLQASHPLSSTPPHWQACLKPSSSISIPRLAVQPKLVPCSLISHADPSTHSQSSITQSGFNKGGSGEFAERCRGDGGQVRRGGGRFVKGCITDGRI